MIRMPGLKWILILSMAVAGGCMTACRTGSPGEVQHMVVCWLKQPGDAAGRQQLIETSKQLQKIPGVLEVRVGEMLPSDRAIVDSTFDAAILISFPSQEAMNQYLVHPRHVKAVKETLMPLVSKIQVYDFVAR